MVTWGAHSHISWLYALQGGLQPERQNSRAAKFPGGGFAMAWPKWSGSFPRKETVYLCSDNGWDKNSLRPLISLAQAQIDILLFNISIGPVISVSIICCLSSLQKKIGKLITKFLKIVEFSFWSLLVIGTNPKHFVENVSSKEFKNFSTTPHIIHRHASFFLKFQLGAYHLSGPEGSNAANNCFLDNLSFYTMTPPEVTTERSLLNSRYAGL